MLWKFESMKGTTEALRKSADAATLLVTRFDDACGIGYLGEYSTGDTLSALAKSCAVGYYTFGHELGHNFGCDHDEDVRMRNIFFLNFIASIFQTNSNPLYPYGHGHLIEGGRHTILAYPSFGHYSKVNYYSNPR